MYPSFEKRNKKKKKKKRKTRQCAKLGSKFSDFPLPENSISFCLLNLAEVTADDEGEHSTPFQEVGEAGNWEEQEVAEALEPDFADSMLIGDDSW